MSANDRLSSSDPQRPIRVNPRGDRLLVEILTPQLLRSAGIEQLEHYLQDVAQGNPARTIVLDFASVQAISSEMIGMLIVLQKSILVQRGRLRLCCLGESVLKTLTLSRVDSAFEIFADAPAALRAD